MKIKHSSSPVLASEGMTSSTMSIDASGMDQSAYFLRDKIYTDKVQAVVREYFCNGLDEHSKYQVERPVAIGLRSTDDGAEFYVRDFAKGLSEEGIRKTYNWILEQINSNKNYE